MKQAFLQSVLAHNRRAITEALENKIILRTIERALYRLSDKKDPKTEKFFLKLNAIRDEIRENNRRLKHLEQLQIVIKRSIKQSI